MNTSLDLSRMRLGWDSIAAFEATLSRPQSVMDSISDYLELRQTFAHQLKETDGLFLEERRNALVALQERLQLLQSLERNRNDGRPPEGSEGRPEPT